MHGSNEMVKMQGSVLELIDEIMNDARSTISQV